MGTNSDECTFVWLYLIFLCHTTSPSVTPFYVCTLVCARAFVVCVFPICNFFYAVSLPLSIYRSLAWSLRLFFSLTRSLFQHNIWIYLIFRKRIMRPMNFFFVSSTLFRSSAYNSWLHRSIALNSAWVFLHTIFVKEKNLFIYLVFFDIVRASFPIEMIACACNTHTYHELDIKRMRVLISYKTCEILTTNERTNEWSAGATTATADWTNGSDGGREKER